MPLPEYKRSLSPGMAQPAEAVSIAPIRQVLDDWTDRQQEREIQATETEAARLGSTSEGVQELYAPSTRAGRAYNKAAVIAHAPQMELDARLMRQEHLDAWNRGEFSGDVAKFSTSLKKSRNALLSNVDPDARMVYGPRIDEIINDGILKADADARAQRIAADRATSDLALSELNNDLMDATQRGDLDEVQNLSIIMGEFRKGQIEQGLKDENEAAGETAKMLRDINTQSHFGEFLEAEDPEEFIYDFRRAEQPDITDDEKKTLLADMKSYATQAEAEQVTQTADWILTQWGEFTYAERLDMITEIDDPKVKAAVAERVEREEKYNRAATAAKQYQNVTGLYEQIFVTQEDVPTTDEIDAIPEEELSFDKKLMVKSWLETGKPDQMSDAERASTWYAAQQKVIRGEWDETDIMEQGGISFDIRDAKSLVGFARNEKDGQAKLQQVQTELQAVYPSVWKNEKRRAQTVYGIIDDINRYEEETGVRIPAEELKRITKDNAEGFVKSSWFNDPDDVDLLQEEYEGIDEPFGRQTAEGAAKVDLWQREALRARRGESAMVKGTWPGAYWSEALGVVVLGEIDGEMHYIYEGKERAMPLDEWGQ